MDVLLVQPGILPDETDPVPNQGNIPPLSLMYLAKPLLEKGFDVQILDRSVSPLDGQDFKYYIERNRPAVVGITSLTVTFKKALKAAAYIKAVDPGIKVVLGGHHVTFTAEDTLKNPDVDVVVRGEGDFAFPRLVEHYIKGKFSLAQVAGISYRQDGKIKENPWELIADIDGLSYPSRDIIDLSRYRRPAALTASRGCPFKCRFCTAGAFPGGKYRLRSSKNILDEIDYLLERLAYRCLYFLDVTLTVFPNRVKTLCRHLLKKDYPVRWSCESRADALDKGMLSLMARTGCELIQFGFESGSEKILNSLGKNITLHQVETCVKHCLEVGIRPIGNFIVGFPGDTWKSVKETIKMAKKLSRMGALIGFGGLTPFPGTYYYNHAKELGLTIHATDWDEYRMGVPIASTKHFTCDELREIIFDTTTESKQYPVNFPSPGV